MFKANRPTGLDCEARIAELEEENDRLEAELVSFEDLEDLHIEVLADRERLLEALGLTEHEWRCRGGASFYLDEGGYVRQSERTRREKEARTPAQQAREAARRRHVEPLTTIEPQQVLASWTKP